MESVAQTLVYGAATALLSVLIFGMGILAVALAEPFLVHTHTKDCEPTQYVQVHYHGVVVHNQTP